MPSPQACLANLRGVHTENATALLLAAGLGLADGYFANVTAAATAASTCFFPVRCWQAVPRRLPAAAGVGSAAAPLVLLQLS